MATAALPPALQGVDPKDKRDPAEPLPLVDQGAGYANDTRLAALGAAALRRKVPTTEEWLQVTWQDVCVDKSYCLNPFVARGTGLGDQFGDNKLEHPWGRT